MSIWILYCHVQCNVLRPHFYLAPKLATFPVSANSCTSSKAGPSCSFILINPRHVYFKYLLLFHIFTGFSSLHPYQNTHELQQFPNICPSLQASSQSIHFMYYFITPSF